MRRGVRDMREWAGAPHADTAHAVNVSLHQLRLFVTLARHRSFTRAGDEFGITQSAVSRGIRELEYELALRLFDRTTRQVTLTETGRKLLARVAPLVEELEAALRPDRDDEHALGMVRIASSSSVTASLLPDWLASFGARFPEMSVTLADKPQSLALDMVRSGEAELGVVVAAESQDTLGKLENFDELAAEPLHTDSLCALLPARHALAGRAKIEWRDLRATPLLLLDDDTGARAAIERALVLHEVAGATRQRLAQASAVARMVSAGLGIGVLPEHAFADPASAHLARVPLTPRVDLTVMLVRRRGRTLAPGAACLWAHLIAASEANRQASPATLRSVEA